MQAAKHHDFMKIFARMLIILNIHKLDKYVLGIKFVISLSQRIFNFPISHDIRLTFVRSAKPNISLLTLFRW